jgi:hypothetical protein
MELRRQALKLRFWPETSPTDDNGMLLDLDWSWVRALPGLNVAELRLHDKIGGQENIRIMFFVTEKRKQDPLPVIWVLAAFPKKRNDFTKNEIALFRARRLLVLKRYY